MREKAYLIWDSDFHLSCSAGDMRYVAPPVPCPRNGFSPCKNVPSGINRQALCVCVCVVCVFVCALHVRARLQVFVCVPARVCVSHVCVKDSCSFCFLVGPRAKSPSSLSKHSFLQGTAIDCHHSPPLINPSRRQSTRSETAAAQNFCLFNFSAGSLGLVDCKC